MEEENKQAIDSNVEKPARAQGARPAIDKRIQEISSLLKESLDEEAEGEVTDEASPPAALENTPNAGEEISTPETNQTIEGDLAASDTDPTLEDEPAKPETAVQAEVEPAALEAISNTGEVPAQPETAVHAEVEPDALEAIPNTEDEPTEPESAVQAEVEPSETSAPSPEPGFAAAIAGSAETQEAPEATGAGAAPVEQGNWITRGQAVLLALGSSALALLLALLLSLGILFGLNQGRLQFASPAQVNELGVRLDGITSRTETLEQDLQGIQARIDDLETMRRRVNAVEEATTRLQTDVDQAAAQLEVLEGEINGVNTRVKSLEASSDRVMSFMEGLRALLDQLFAPQGSGK